MSWGTGLFHMVPYGGSATGNGVGSFDSNGVLRVSSLFFPSVSFYLEYIYVYFIIYIMYIKNIYFPPIDKTIILVSPYISLFYSE